MSVDGGQPDPGPIPRRLLLAAAAIDARSAALPGAVLVAGERVVAAGSPESIGRPADAVVARLPDAVLLPALVNAHAHLDLTHLGPRRFDPARDSFADWLAAIRRERATDAAAIAASVARGVALSRAGGTGIVGDVAGAGGEAARRALAESGLRGVSFRESFGTGGGVAAACAALEEVEAAESRSGRATGRVRVGHAPHAPYSVAAALLEATLATGRPTMMHVAETPEEVRLLADGAGPLAAMLARFGAEPSDAAGCGLHPIDWALARRGATGRDAAHPFTLVHLNAMRREHPERLAAAGVAVAWCPRASRYFGHPRDGEAPHGFAALLEAGVPVALGTDSIVGIGRADRISVLDEMRHARAAAGADPASLLAMATVHGATALGLDPGLVTFAGGAGAGVIAVPLPRTESAPRDARAALDAILRDDAAPSWVLGG